MKVAVAVVAVTMMMDRIGRMIQSMIEHLVGEVNRNRRKGKKPKN